MKATEQYFPVVLFIMLYKVVITFESAHETIQMEASAEYVNYVNSSLELKVK